MPPFTLSEFSCLLLTFSRLQLTFSRFQNSNLAGVNMRVANLRGSCLKNSSLKGACLAGADLEVSPLVVVERFVGLAEFTVYKIIIFWLRSASDSYQF